MCSLSASHWVPTIDSYLDMPGCGSVVLDFTGIRSSNSSFVNALISGLFEQHGTAALKKLAGVPANDPGFGAIR